MKKSHKAPTRKRPIKRAQKTPRKISKHPSTSPETQMIQVLKLGVYYPDYGGAFHGLARGEEGKPDYWLFSATKNQNASSTFDENAEYAKTLKVGQYNDYHMPTRRELRLQWINAAPGQFESEWYWSCEQSALDSDSAWSQDFYYGTQTTWPKDDRSRGCAVRRVPIR